MNDLRLPALLTLPAVLASPAALLPVAPAAPEEQPSLWASAQRKGFTQP